MANTKKLLKRKKYNNVKTRKNKNKNRKRKRKVRTQKGGLIILSGYRNINKKNNRKTGNKHRYHRFASKSPTNLRKNLLDARGILNTGTYNKINQTQHQPKKILANPTPSSNPLSRVDERNKWAKKFFLYNSNKGSVNTDLVLLSPELKRLMNKKEKINLRRKKLENRKSELLSKKQIF